MAKLHNASPEEFEQEEQTSSKGSESESESEPELTQPQVNSKSTPALVSKKSKPQPSKVPTDSSQDDNESDSETNYYSPIKKSNSIVKLPMDDTLRNPNSKNSKSNVFRTPSMAGAKRLSEIAKESKRLKRGWKLMKGEKREEMEERRKKLRLKDIAVHMENLRFKLEYADIVFEVMDSE